MKVFKISMIVMVVILLALLASPELYYRYQLQKISPVKPESISSHSQGAKNALWADLEKTSIIKMEPYSTLSFIYNMLEVVIANDYERARFPAGNRVAHQVGRLILFKEQKRFGHLEQIVINIWASNNFTADEALNYLLDYMYFGFGNYGLDQASNYYYGKPEVELSESETIALIATIYAPASFNLYCRQERFSAKTTRLAKKMNALWPTKYGDYTFPAPIKRKDIKCP